MAPVNLLLPQMINALVDLDPEARDLLATLAGKHVAVQIKGTGLHFPYRCSAGGHWHADPQEATDLIVRLSVSAISALLLGGPPADLAGYRALGIELEGDLAVARVLHDAWRKFQFDWEEPVSRVTGDAAARRLCNLGREMGRGAERARSALQRAASEQLQYQLALIPAKAEVEQFVREVDDLRAQADRLRERIRLLGIALP